MIACAILVIYRRDCSIDCNLLIIKKLMTERDETFQSTFECCLLLCGKVTKYIEHHTLYFLLSTWFLLSFFLNPWANLYFFELFYLLDFVSIWCYFCFSIRPNVWIWSHLVLNKLQTLLKAYYIKIIDLLYTKENLYLPIRKI